MIAPPVKSTTHSRPSAQMKSQKSLNWLGTQAYYQDACGPEASTEVKSGITVLPSADRSNKKVWCLQIGNGLIETDPLPR